MIRADIRALWRAKYADENPPAPAALSEVTDDLERLARGSEPDPEPERPVGEARQAARVIDRILAMPDCPLPGGYQIPDGYEVEDNGVWYVLGRWGPARVSWAWLFPVRVYVDPAGDQWIELVWRDHGKWISRLVRRSVSKSGRKLIAEFGDAALPVTDSEARDAETWIAAAEAVNHAVIARHPVARQLGWQADGKTFVTAADTPWRIEPSYPDQIPPLAAHHQRGTLEDWQRAIAPASPYQVPQVGVYAGLAAVLLEVLGLDSFTVDIAGRSTRGKSVTAMMALSCWADPSEKSDGVFSWQTTVIQAEKRLNLVNGLVVVFDETRLVKDPSVVDTIVYGLPKNRGKPRGGGWPNMIPWRTILVSTGEQPALSFVTHQGASARVLSIRQAPFGAESEANRSAADAVKHGIEGSFGAAGPAFAARLQALLATGGGERKLRERHGAMTSKLRGDTDMSGRRAPSIAALALAAELAHDWHITPWRPPSPAEWLAIFAVDDQRDDRPQMALEIVREYIAANQDRMYDAAADHPPASGWIGHEAKEGPALLIEGLRSELQRRGYDLEAVLPGWLEMGALLTMPSQRPVHQIPRRTGGRLAKHMIFVREIIDAGGAGE